jgi:teichuronic acid biosynthesis glycosyltransferase TuaH
VYIGTIASWMDWSLIMSSLEKDDSYVYHFVGPTEIPIPAHPRIIAYGPKPHHTVKKIMSEADILIMPFLVSELIESVNPVKLYEYIFSGKPCISVRYGESIVFEDYVYLYNGIDEYLNVLKLIDENDFKAKSSLPEAEAFCKANTWEARGKVMFEVLNAK